MAKYSIEDSTLTGIANSIRARNGNATQIPVTDFASQILAIPTGGKIETCNFMYQTDDERKVIPLMLPIYENGEIVYKSTFALSIFAGDMVPGLVCGGYIVYAKDPQRRIVNLVNCEAEPLSAESVAILKITAAKNETVSVTQYYVDL